MRSYASLVVYSHDCIQKTAWLYIPMVAFIRQHVCIPPWLHSIGNMVVYPMVAFKTAWLYTPWLLSRQHGCIPHGCFQDSTVIYSHGCFQDSMLVYSHGCIQDSMAVYTHGCIHKTTWLYTPMVAFIRQHGCIHPWLHL